MKKKLLLVLLALFCVTLQAQEVTYLVMPLSELKNGGRLWLLHKKSQHKIRLRERYADFIQKFGAPTNKKEWIADCIDFDLVMIEAKYKKNIFTFYNKTIYDPNNNIMAAEGLKEYRLYDGMLVLYDKERGISIGVGDGEKELRKFAPNYRIGGGGISILFKGRDYKGKDFKSSFFI